MKSFTYFLGLAIFLGSLTAVGCGGGGIEPGMQKDADAEAGKPPDMSKMPGYEAQIKGKTGKKK